MQEPYKWGRDPLISNKDTYRDHYHQMSVKGFVILPGDIQLHLPHSLCISTGRFCAASHHLCIQSGWAEGIRTVFALYMINKRLSHRSNVSSDTPYTMLFAATIIASSEMVLAPYVVSCSTLTNNGSFSS